MRFTNSISHITEMNKSFGCKSKGNIFYDTSKTRKNIIIALTGSVLFASLLIIHSPAEIKTFLTDIIQLLAALAAAVISIVILYRQKVDGVIGKAFAFLAAGFVLYLVAEVVRSYIEIGLGIENHFLSISYALWLAGYASFFYFISKMYHLLWASHSRRHQISVSLTCTVFLISLLIPLSGTAELSPQEGKIAFLIPTVFLALDIALLIPSALILLNPRKGPLTPIPWIFCAIVLLTIGNSVLAYTHNVPSLRSSSWVANIFFITAYLTAASGLFWHNRFFIGHQKEKSSEPVKFEAKAFHVQQDTDRDRRWPISKT